MRAVLPLGGHMIIPELTQLLLWCRVLYCFILAYLSLLTLQIEISEIFIIFAVIEFFH